MTRRQIRSANRRADRDAARCSAWHALQFCRIIDTTHPIFGIAANESYFQVSERAAPGFLKALRRATIAPEDQGLLIELAEPREQGSAGLVVLGDRPGAYIVPVAIMAAAPSNSARAPAPSTPPARLIIIVVFILSLFSKRPVRRFA